MLNVLAMTELASRRSR